LVLAQPVAAGERHKANPTAHLDAMARLRQRQEFKETGRTVSYRDALLAVSDRRSA
jgi:hypothetical protein